MSMDPQATRSPALGAWLRDTVFFVVFLLYLRWGVDLRLIGHCAGPLSGDLPVFYRGWTFFREFAGHPGGPAEYAGAFLFQLFTHAWMGPLAVTGVAWSLSLVVGRCFTAAGFPRLRSLRHLPAVLLLAIYSQYTHDTIGIVALLAAILLVPAYLRIAARGPRPALACFIVASPVVYYIAGAAYLVFAAACLLHEALIRRRWRLTACGLVVAVAVPYVIGVLLCGVPPTAAVTPYAFSWNVAIPGQPRWAIDLLYLLVPAGLILAGVAGWIQGLRTPAHPAGAGDASAVEKPLKKNRGSSTAKNRRTSEKRDPWDAGASKPFRLAGLVLPFVIAAATAYFTFAPGRKCLLAVDFYAYHGRWDRVLEESRHDPTDPAVAQTVCRALYHTGRIAEEMFSYPQSVPALLAGTDEPMSWQWAEIWLDAGFLNAAEHNLAQAQEMLGEQPVILQRLALIHMAKGNTGTAKIYLNALARTLIMDEWARKCLADLELDPELSHDPQVQWLRGAMPKSAELIQDRSLDGWFQVLLARNPRNRPAFEYLMALCLVAGRPDKVVENLHRLNEFDYTRPYLPEHYAEAVVAYTASGKGGNPDLHGWQLREATRQRFRDCMEIARRYHGNPDAMKRELRRSYPGSYFRYLLAGESGTP